MGQNYSLTPEDIRQLNVQTNFGEEDIRKFYDDFIKDFPSGRVTKDDVKKLYKKIFPTGDPTPLVEQIFRTYDVDRNGTVDFREFLCGVGVVTNGTDHQRLRLAFRIFDLDQSGAITKDEYHAIFTGLYKAMGVFYGKEDKNFEAESFEQLDTNRDAKISYDEFEAMAKRDPVVTRLMNFDHPAPEDK